MQNVTLSAWVRTTEGGSTYNSNWSILDFDNANYYAFYVRGDNGKVGFSFCNNQGSSTAVRHLSSNTAVNDGRWHHITVVFGDKTNPNNYTDVKFYIDGQLDNHSYNANWGPTIGKPNTTRYGFIGDGSKATSPYNLGMRYKKYYHGSIDELAYWHSSLTTAQVQNLYNSGVQAITTNPQAWYSFDNQTTATVYDNSPNGYNGTAFKNGNTGSPQQFTPATAQRITASSALATVLSYTDYYPFGMTMPGRQANLGSYRYGFQNQETDPEMLGGAVAFKYRVHDVRIGRFLSVDPIAPEYPWNSPYAFAENRVIDGIDLEGQEHVIRIYSPSLSSDFIKAYDEGDLNRQREILHFAMNNRFVSPETEDFVERKLDKNLGTYRAGQKIAQYSYDESAKEGLTIIPYLYGKTPAGVKIVSSTGDIMYYPYDDGNFMDMSWPTDLRPASFYGNNDFVGYYADSEAILGKSSKGSGLMWGHLRGWGFYIFTVKTIEGSGVDITLIANGIVTGKATSPEYVNPKYLKGTGTGDSRDAGIASEGIWTATEGNTTTWTGCTTGLSIGLPNLPQISIPILGIDFGSSSIITNTTQIYP